MNGLQVFRRHDILVVNFQFNITFLILHRISTAAHLHTSPPIGRSIHLIQTKVTLAGHCHAQSSMTEHLDTNQFSARPAYMLLFYLTIDFCDLLQIKFTGKYHHIGKLCVKLQSLSIGDIQLRGKMHFLPYFATIGHHRNIGSNHRRDIGFFGCVHNGAHQHNIIIIDNRIDGEITFQPVLIAYLRYFFQIVDCKRACRTGTHIQTLDTEINRIRTRLYGCRQ